MKKMKTLDLVQGSDEWLEARLQYLCASEAPVIMGCSKFMSRRQLLDLKKGWKSNPIGYFKQKLFDKGHEFEDSAREFLELDLCEDLPPVVGVATVSGVEFLASFDGLSDFDIVWEHKSWNAVLAENIRNGVIEPLYFWQLEQLLMVSGSETVVFMASDGTRENRVSMEYKSVPERRAELIAGSKQFLADLEQHEIAPKKEAVVAKRQGAFPAIECHVEGAVVVSNLGEYIPVIQRLADEQMNIVLETDQDFADKDSFNKSVKDGRASLKIKAKAIESEFESLAEFSGYVDQADGILQKLQSHGEKQVKQSKETKKLSITNGAQSAIQAHLAKLSGAINGIQVHGIAADWNSVIKGKRSFEKMQDAVDNEVANLKITANEIAATIRGNLDSLTELAGDHRFLFSDHAELILKNNDDLINLIKMRISDHEVAEEERRELARLERERQQIKEEEEAKARLDAAQIKGRKEKVAAQSFCNDKEEGLKKTNEAVEPRDESVAEQTAAVVDLAGESSQPAVLDDPQSGIRAVIMIEVSGLKRKQVIDSLAGNFDVEMKSDSYLVIK